MRVALRISPFRRRVLIALVCLPVVACDSARDVEGSWDLASWTAREVHRGAGAELCARFSDEMLAVVSCEALERLLSQVHAAMGEPVSECRWAYTYRISALDPLVATTVRSCPFRSGELSVTVTAQVDRNREQVVGLWLDAPSIRGLSLEP
jgi:hypothetical protein